MKHDWKFPIAAAIMLFVGCMGRSIAQSTPDESTIRQLFKAGQAAKSAGRFAEAIADFESLEKIDGSIAEVHATLGVLYYQRGNYQRAIVEIRDARRLNPSLPGLDALLSFSLAESGREKEALRGLEKAFHFSTDPEIKRQAGLELMRAYSHLDMDRSAAETALQLRDLYKADPEVLYNAGKILGNSAYATMQSLFHSGNSIWTHLAEGEALESQGQIQDAIEYYHQVLELEPHRPNIHYRIGRAYLKHWETTHAPSDLSLAEEEFASELDVDPANANAAYELAGLYRQKGNYTEALRLYESAAKFFPDFEEAQVGLGGVLLDEKQASQAIPHLVEATKLRPDDPVAWYRLARAEYATGDKDAAAKDMAEFKKVHGTQNVESQRPNSPGDITPQKLDADASSQTSPQ